MIIVGRANQKIDVPQKGAQTVTLTKGELANLLAEAAQKGATEALRQAEAQKPTPTTGIKSWLKHLRFE